MKGTETPWDLVREAAEPFKPAELAFLRRALGARGLVALREWSARISSVHGHRCAVCATRILLKRMPKARNPLALTLWVTKQPGLSWMTDREAHALNGGFLETRREAPRPGIPTWEPHGVPQPRQPGLSSGLTLQQVRRRFLSSAASLHASGELDQVLPPDRPRPSQEEAAAQAGPPGRP